MGDFWSRWAESPAEYVYFTRFVDVLGQPYIKIGVTFHPLPARMAAIASEMRRRREVLLVEWESLGVIPGGVEMERAVHERFDDYRMRIFVGSHRLRSTEFFEDEAAIAGHVGRHGIKVPKEWRGPDRKFCRWRDKMLRRHAHEIALMGWMSDPADGWGDVQRLLPIGAAAFL